MKLYYSPGSCSLAAHIVLEESGAQFETERINTREREQFRPEFVTLNPKSKVPVLVLDDGKILTENGAILSYVADLHPEAGLLSAPGSYERARAQEWVAWCASAVHPGFWPLFNSARFVEGEAAQANMKELAKVALQKQLDYFDAQLAGKKFVLGDQFSIADSYSIVFYRWAKTNQLVIGDNWKATVKMLLERPAVKRALATQQISIEI